tara:strand:- start:1150 stop:2085 length:936 start_codon:yes stop_codon:yes gene_type:complete
MGGKKGRKGIILSGGSGSRLSPLTNALSKQLMPIYDKPMIYYPLSTLMLAGIREILIITTPNDQNSFKRLLGDGESWGIKINYQIQLFPEGLSQALTLAESFLADSFSALILGDNLFHGSSLIDILNSASKKEKGATIFAYPVSNPERYGVVVIDKNSNIIQIQEKPKESISSLAITGLYFYDNTVVERAKEVKKSERGEYEITDLNNMYLSDNLLEVKNFGRGMSWFDTGTHDSLFEASSFIKTLQNRQDLKIGCPEEISWRNGWISDTKLEELAQPLRKSGYGDYLIQLLSEGSSEHHILQRNIGKLYN